MKIIGETKVVQSEKGQVTKVVSDYIGNGWTLDRSTPGVDKETVNLHFSRQSDPAGPGIKE